MGDRGADLRTLTEQQARDWVIENLSSSFDFTLEVEATDPLSGDTYRLDALSVCKSTNYIVGWEFKKSFLFKKEFAHALRQAIYYRHSRINDQRMLQFAGKQPDICVVCPDWDGLHASSRIDYEKTAEGMRLLVSHFRVGVFQKWEKPEKLVIKIGEQAVWHSDKGWNGNAAGVLKGKRPTASSKRFDPSSE